MWLIDPLLSGDSDIIIIIIIMMGASFDLNSSIGYPVM
jgi:hypothetical protein